MTEGMRFSFPRACPHGVARCRCELPGAPTNLHGQRPAPCSRCGGETGMHAFGCTGTDTAPATAIVGVDLSEDDFRKLCDYELDAPVVFEKRQAYGLYLPPPPLAGLSSRRATRRAASAAALRALDPNTAAADVAMALGVPRRWHAVFASAYVRAKRYRKFLETEERAACLMEE